MQALSSALAQREATGCITVGSRVTVRFSNGNIRTFTITNQSQAVAPDKGVISDQSPLGAVLLGKTEGEVATFVVGTQPSSVEIVEVGTAKRK